MTKEQYQNPNRGATCPAVRKNTRFGEESCGFSLHWTHSGKLSLCVILSSEWVQYQLNKLGMVRPQLQVRTIWLAVLNTPSKRKQKPILKLTVIKEMLIIPVNVQFHSGTRQHYVLHCMVICFLVSFDRCHISVINLANIASACTTCTACTALMKVGALQNVPHCVQCIPKHPAPVCAIACWELPPLGKQSPGTRCRH